MRHAPVLVTAAVLLLLRSSSCAFSPSKVLSNPARVKSSLPTLYMSGWEDLLYNAESAASSVASSGLNDPTNFLTSVPMMYGAGLLTSISPCVWSLLPLTMSYISTAAGERKDGKVTLPTIAFAAGLAVVFCSLGIAAAQLGGVFGGTSSSGVLLPILSNAICLLMGFKLLDLIDLPLPSFDFLTSRGSTNSDELIFIDEKGQVMDSKMSRKDEEGSLFRTFLLGGSSALVASPCATPVLTSILAFVASSKSPVLGAAFLFVYTLGYSTPLLLIASTGGQALVKLRQTGGSTGVYAKIAPWVSPITAGVLLWYGTNGMLTALFGDPSLAGLAPVIE